MVDIPLQFVFNPKALLEAFSELTGNRAISAERAFEKIKDTASRAKNPVTIYIGMGSGEVAALLKRRFGEAEQQEKPKPRIKSIRIVRMSDPTIDSLLERDLIAKDFKERLASNLNTIKKLCKAERIEYQLYEWPRFPQFHGFICGDQAYIGKWTVNENGYFCHDTMLFPLTAKKNPEVIEALREPFKGR